MTDTQTYQEYQDQITEEQADMTKEDVMELPVEYQIDLDNLPRQNHNFVKRGIVISCEGANHPTHRHFLTARRSPIHK